MFYLNCWQEKVNDARKHSNSCLETGGRRHRKDLDFFSLFLSCKHIAFDFMCTHQSCGGETLPFPDNAIKSRVLHVTSPLLSAESNKSPHTCHNKGAITLKAVNACVWILIQSSWSIKAVRWKCTQGVDTAASLGAELCTAVQGQGCTRNNGRWDFCRLHIIKSPAVHICYCV